MSIQFSRATAFWSTLALGAILLMPGCGGEDETGPAPDEGASQGPEVVEREVPAPQTEAPAETPEDKTNFRVVPDLDGRLEQDGTGLDMIIDASSKQAYADSLDWIADDTSAAQFNKLEQSIKYINMYDPRVVGNEQRMLQVLDGMTGQEVIEHAMELQRKRRG